MDICGVKLKMSSSRNVQTDGASEVMNRMVENYLRCYCSHHWNDWDVILSSAEFACNSVINDNLGMSPFEMDLAWNPKSPIDMLARNYCNAETVQATNKGSR